MLKKLSGLPILATVMLLGPLRAIAQQTQAPTVPQPGYYWPGPWHMWGDGYAWPFWWIFPLMMLLMLLACAAMFFFGRAHHSQGPRPYWNDPSQSALQILSERFARGEIKKDEYEEKKGVILSARQH